MAAGRPPRRMPGRPKGTPNPPYPGDEQAVLETLSLMRDKGMSRQAALRAVDPNPSDIRRRERKMKKAEGSRTAREHIDQVGRQLLDMVASNLLRQEEQVAYFSLRDHGTAWAGRGTLRELDTAAAVYGTLRAFFDNPGSAAAEIRKAAALAGGPDLAHFPDSTVTLLPEVRFMDLAGPLLKRIEEGYSRILAGEVVPPAYQAVDIGYHTRGISRAARNPAERQRLDSLVADMMAGYGRVAGNTWDGDALMMEDFLLRLVGDCDSFQEAAEHCLGAVASAIAQVARRTGATTGEGPMRFDIAFERTGRLSIRKDMKAPPGASPNSGIVDASRDDVQVRPTGCGLHALAA